METTNKSKNPVQDYRKAVIAVLCRYYDIEAGAVRFSTKAARLHRAAGENPAYAAFSIGREHKLPVAPSFQRQRGR